MNEINLYQYIKSATIWSKNEVQMPVEEIIAMQHQIINLNYSKLLGEIKLGPNTGADSGIF